MNAGAQIFAFADRYRGKYSDILGGVVCPYYCSYSGFNESTIKYQLIKPQTNLG